MRRFLFAPILTVMLLFGAMVAPVGAITGGQPDGDGHPQVALLLAPGLTFCSGALIAPSTILTAGHCTSFWTELAADPDVGLENIQVSFDSQASVDADWMPDGGTWYTASSWVTHPGYVDADWPFTYDYGLLYLDAPVSITPATLADVGTLDPIIDSNGQTDARFEDVGYGIQGTIVGGGAPPRRAITWERKVSLQRYAPGNGATSGIFHETWFILNNQPSAQHGGGCGGDSGSPIFAAGTTEIVAVHTGGYRLGYNGVLCGRMTALNHRTDINGDYDVYDWILANAR
jgi:hypothetical protein